MKTFPTREKNGRTVIDAEALGPEDVVVLVIEWEGYRFEGEVPRSDLDGEPSNPENVDRLAKEIAQDWFAEATIRFEIQDADDEEAEEE
jgi:hypothetical protein